MKEFLHETFFLLTFVEVSFIGVQELQRNGRSSTTSVFGSDNFHFISFPFNNLMFFEEIIHSYYGKHWYKHNFEIIIPEFY